MMDTLIYLQTDALTVIFIMKESGFYAPDLHFLVEMNQFLMMTSSS